MTTAADAPSASSLAATKLRPPVRPARLVERTRLHDVLDAAVADEVPLVLVSAPAGSGKSTLVAAWVSAQATPAAWLQLDESDADPARFWVSVNAAIGAVAPEVAERLEPVISGSLGTGQVVVPALVNELAAVDERIVLVLDDVHLVDDADVHRGLERLVDLAPAQLTVVVISRADPPFRLGRMRVRDRVREIRAGDLRFQPDEATGLLGPAAPALDRQRLDELCERTEGWAAGLVLAGLSLARAEDVDRFVQSFHGDDQLVVGYLTDELLGTLAEEERRRMVEAAVLHRLSGPLLDAVTGSSDGARWLERLAAGNQLVIRLDGVGEWYRYHHLFRDMLLLEARRSMPERLPELHHRAAAWFETSGHPAAAVDHLLATGDRERAMYLMRIVGPDLLGTGRLRTLRNIIERLSAGGELDAICSMLSGWDHYLRGRYDRAQQLLDRAVEMLPADVEPMRAMPLRINLALGMGDVATALSGAREVVAAGQLDERPSELTTAVGAAFAWAGMAAEARAVLDVALDRTRAEHRITAHAMALVAASVAEFHGGTTDEAIAAAERALEYARTSGLGEYHGIAPALAISATLDRTSATAVVDADRAIALAKRAATRLGLVFSLSIAADVLLREGEDRGHAALGEARTVMAECPDPGIVRGIVDRIMARHRLAGVRAASADLVEALSERELAVLSYLPSTLSLPAIARELYVSPNTVKTQCGAIYRKLGVNGRHEAVEAARRRNLI